MSRRETRANFLARLKRTAKNLPPSFVLGCFKNMKVRCARLGAAEGGLFEEGGREAIVPTFVVGSPSGAGPPAERGIFFPEREGHSSPRGLLESSWVTARDQSLLALSGNKASRGCGA